MTCPCHSPRLALFSYLLSRFKYCRCLRIHKPKQNLAPVPWPTCDMKRPAARPAVSPDPGSSAVWPTCSSTSCCFVVGLHKRIPTERTANVWFMQRHWNDRALYETLRDFSLPLTAPRQRVRGQHWTLWRCCSRLAAPPRGRPAPRLCRGEPSAARVPAPPVGAPRLHRMVLVLLRVLGSKMVNEGSVCWSANRALAQASGQAAWGSTTRHTRLLG